MRSPLNWLDILLFVWSFLMENTIFLRTIKALARLRLCAVSPEPLLVALMISALLSCANSILSLLPGVDKIFRIKRLLICTQSTLESMETVNELVWAKMLSEVRKVIHGHYKDNISAELYLE